MTGAWMLPRDPFQPPLCPHRLARSWRQPLQLDRLPTIDAEQLRVLWQPAHEPQIFVPKAGLRMPGRLDPLVRLARFAAEQLHPAHSSACLELQLHDEQPPAPALRMDAPQGAATPSHGVIPDPYCLGSAGFLAFRQQLHRNALPPWKQRQPRAIWRGASTDAKQITLHNLSSSRRYRLCRASLQLPQMLDARFTDVVQCEDPRHRQSVQEHLLEQGLMAPRMEPWTMAQSQWLLDLDGNVNSWGLLWKLLSGSCVIRVNSSRSQWFHHRLEPFRHLVPVRGDLADLEERLHWCWGHPAECAAIASAGQRLALEVVADLGVDLLTALRAAKSWLTP